MPKAEVGTPKWLSNRMKSKGLQRLRWYCQMCEKQCRDENGFKCHRMSEGHLRQMQVFSQRAGKYMDEFSRKFEAAFMHLMRTRYCRARVLANTVYCDLIANKQHVHMNATVWSTLGEFVMYLKRSGKCEVEQSEQGWYIEFVDRNRLEIEEREEILNRHLMSCEQQREKILSRQYQEAWDTKKDDEPKPIHPYNRPEGEEQLEFKLAIPTEPKEPEPPIVSFNLKKISETLSAHDENSFESGSNSKRKLTALERLKIEQERKRGRRAEPAALPDQGSSERNNPEPTERTLTKETEPADLLDSEDEDKKESSDTESITGDNDEPWLVPNLVVRIISSELDGGKYLGKKGGVTAVRDKYLGEVKVTSSGDLVLLDQEMLEPVIPARSGAVRIIRGEDKGQQGVIVNVDIDRQEAEVLIQGQPKLYEFRELCKISS